MGDVSLGIDILSQWGDCCMMRMLSLQADFRFEKSMLQLVIENAGHHCLYLPKYPCEFNLVEMHWVMVKEVSSHAYKVY